ncbi:MAG: hypothetical protein EOO43_26490, partial [Flavobacterium sp.]
MKHKFGINPLLNNMLYKITRHYKQHPYYSFLYSKSFAPLARAATNHLQSLDKIVGASTSNTSNNNNEWSSCQHEKSSCRHEIIGIYPQNVAKLRVKRTKTGIFKFSRLESDSLKYDGRIPEINKKKPAKVNAINKSAYLIA